MKLTERIRILKTLSTFAFIPENLPVRKNLTKQLKRTGYEIYAVLQATTNFVTLSQTMRQEHNQINWMKRLIELTNSEIN